MGASALFHFDKLVVAQCATNDIGKGVQTFIINFDQTAYEAFLFGHGSPKATRDYRRIRIKDHAPTRNSTACITLQSPKLNIQVRGMTHDAVCCSHRHIYLPLKEAQLLSFERNHNAEKRHHKSQAATIEECNMLGCVAGKQSACAY